MQKIMVGMSGGVDSSVAAALLKESGYTAVGATLRLFDKSEDTALSEANDAKAVCDRLEIQHSIIDLRDNFFASVITDFIAEYEAGRTPNPCIVCNKNIKFGDMLESALNLGCDGIATGHYAQIKRDGERFLLTRAKDTAKDQTYVLYCLTQKQLSHLVLPLGSLTKEQVREFAEAHGFINARKKDSQDICFVPDGDYAAFIERTANKGYPQGDFVDKNGNFLGRHNGLINYTIGQRKGLGIALGKPAFVLDKDVANNRVVLGDEDGLFFSRVEVEDVNFIPFDTLNADMRLTAKLRYRHTEQPATLHLIDKNKVLIEFDTPQRAPSPGQSAVFYDGDIVIGGGKIVKGL